MHIFRSWWLSGIFFTCGVVPWLCRQSDPVGWLCVHWEVYCATYFPIDTQPANRIWLPTQPRHYTTREKIPLNRQLLKIGTRWPETCWATYKGEINIILWQLIKCSVMSPLARMRPTLSVCILKQTHAHFTESLLCCSLFIASTRFDTNTSSSGSSHSMPAKFPTVPGRHNDISTQTVHTAATWENFLELLRQYNFIVAKTVLMF